MRTIPDDELRSIVKIGIGFGWSMQETYYRIRNGRTRLGWQRLRRVWLAEGGTLDVSKQRVVAG